jgi:hypothetical protein
MKVNRVTVGLSAVLVAAASTATSAALAVTATSARTGQVVLVQCGGVGQVRPASTDEPGCMPSNEFIAGLSWTTWRSAAFGSGTLRVNNCILSSSCGPAKFTRYPILVVLWRPKPWPHHPGGRHFTRMTVIFTGKRPGGPPAQTVRLPAS